jgi:Fe2+ or Zn2+ uptake regulation protein
MVGDEMTDRWRQIEAAILEFLRSEQIELGNDGLGGHHFVVADQCPKVDDFTQPRARSLAIACSQTGDCDYHHHRIEITALAKFMAAFCESSK